MDFIRTDSLPDINPSRSIFNPKPKTKKRKKQRPHRLVIEFEELRNKAGVSKLGIEKKSGIRRNNINNWLTDGVMPTLANFEKALNTLGYQLEIKRKERT